MGGTTFEQFQLGVDVKQAFQEAGEQAAYEYGHGGYTGTLAEKGEYTIISPTPLIESEARALADRLIQECDPRIDDKWGPAGAIPVVLDTRQVQVRDFSYLHEFDFGKKEEERDKIQPSLLEAVTPLVKLRRGETIKNVGVSGYSQPQRAAYRTGYERAEHRTSCSATVVINKAPTTRRFTITADISGGLDYDTFNKEVARAARAAKLRAGESYVNHQVVEDRKGKVRVVADAPKAKAETRFVWRGLHSVHATWDTGFESQAQARAALAEYLDDDNHNRFHQDVTTVEIESVTRRVGGEPLVRVTREVAKHTITIEVEVRLANAKAADIPDGWLFFGWASE